MPRMIPQPKTPEDAEAFWKNPFGSPTDEYCKYKGYDNPEAIELADEVSNRDLLVAFLRSADCICHELRCIREAVEK